MFNLISAPLETVEQYRYPRSKKQRTRRKWARRIANYRAVPSHVVSVEGFSVYAHAAMIERIEGALEHAIDGGEMVF